MAQTQNVWPALFARGIFAIIFGILVAVYPGLSLALLITFFGAFAVVAGVTSIAFSIANRMTDSGWKMHCFEGVIGVLAGLAVFIWPGLTGLLLLYIIAVWAIISGLAQFLASFKLPGGATQTIIMIIGGLVSIVFGAYVIYEPFVGAVAIAWLISAYAIIIGVLSLIVSMQMRKT